MMFVSVVIAAGGSSKRMKGGNKLLFKLSGRSVLSRAIDCFADRSDINEIIVVVSPESRDEYIHVMSAEGVLEKVRITTGGRTRMESVRFGLLEVSEDTDVVLIHDAARPLVSGEIIRNCIDAAFEFGAACPAVPLADTLKEGDRKGFVKRTIPRDNLYKVQTPQAFMFRDILKLHKKAAFRGLKVTDDAAIAEYFGFEVYLVESEYSNIKITTETDLILAEALILNGNDAGAHDAHTPAEGS